MRYQEWLCKWLKNYVNPTSKRRTFMRYEEIVRQHLIPSLGECELSELTPYQLQCFVTELSNNGNLITGKGLSPNSVNAVISVIQSSLKTAYSMGFISEYNADRIKRPKPSEKKVECFSFEEQKKIENYILSSKKDKLLGILLCLYTGVRIGELLALQWSDISFEKEEIYITKTCYDGKDENGIFGRITDAPKTVSSFRIIPIPKQLITIVKKYKKRSLSAFVVSNDNKTIALRSYQRTFSSVLKKLNIPHRGFHSLRHTFATRALECGMDVKTLSEILGHKSSTVTLNRYVHSLTKHKKDMINLVGKLL